MDEDAIVQEILDDAAAALGIPADEIVAAVIDESFPWLKEGHLVWARTPNFQHAIYWIPPSGAPLRLNGSDPLPVLSKLLVANTGALPGGLTPVQLGQAVRCLTFEPRGEIATPEFLQRLGPYLQRWLRPDNAANRKLFADQCTGAVLTSPMPGRWTLEFNCFNVRGGVELWMVEGDATAVLTAAKTEKLPKGTFFWPMA